MALTMVTRKVNAPGQSIVTDICIFIDFSKIKTRDKHFFIKESYPGTEKARIDLFKRGRQKCAGFNIVGKELQFHDVDFSRLQAWANKNNAIEVFAPNMEFIPA